MLIIFNEESNVKFDIVIEKSVGETKENMILKYKNHHHIRSPRSVICGDHFAW
jgi:hypothetical protein